MDITAIIISGITPSATPTTIPTTAITLTIRGIHPITPPIIIRVGHIARGIIPTITMAQAVVMTIAQELQ